jgi:hypothetical protein
MGERKRMIDESSEPQPGLPRRVAAALLHFPPPRGAAVLALLCGLALLLRSERSHGLLAAAIHGFDLVIHEAGHPIFGLFGWRFLAILGGTLAQLTPPVAAMVVFWRRGQPASVATTVTWLGVNLVNVGQYAADARDRSLPLVNADASGHDWGNMLGALGLVEQGEGIGAAIGALGWTLQLLGPAWAALLWLRWRLEQADRADRAEAAQRRAR